MTRTTNFTTILYVLLTGGIAASFALGSCGGSGDADSSGTAGSGGGGVPNDGAGAAGAGGLLLDGAGDVSTEKSPTKQSNYPCQGCDPFPPLDASQCAPGTLAAPTVAYPPDGVLLPPNMNVLEVQFVPPSGATLFEVDFENAATDVRVETKCTQVPDVRGGASRGCGVTLPQPAWNDIANTNRDGDPLTVTVRATKDGTCVATSTTKVDVRFAKEDLTGGIYYWQSATYGGTGGKTGGIYSHDFGTFDPTPTPFYTSGASGTCVGCHNLSRDGARIALATDDPDADDEFGDVKTHVLDVATRTVLGGRNMSPGFQTFTHDHAKMIASTWKTKNAGFAVFDGDGTTLLHTATLAGGLAPTQPDLSADDKTLVYVVPKSGTISTAGDHHFMSGSLYASPFDGTGNTLGAPTPLLTTSDATTYYYPSFSPNGTFLIMNEAADGDVFYNRKARVKLLHYPPAQGAAPLDLPALNVADGLSNSWPRWSPFVQTYKTHKLLWVTFSSNRDYGLHLVNQGFDNCYPPESPAYDQPQPLSKQGVGYENCAQPQIWMAAILVDEDGTLDTSDRSFPAFWLPFQDVNSHNHSAQWVDKILGGGGGPPDGGSDSGSEGGPDASACAQSGESCANGCCTDVVCCGATCTDVCVR